MEYRIYKEDCASKLEDTVAFVMQIGWRPIGGVAVVQDESSVSRQMIWAQAMVREPQMPDGHSEAD